MANLPRPDQVQLAGVPAVFFVEHRKVAGWPPASAGALVGELALLDDEAWTQLVGRVYTPALEQKIETTPQGPVYPVELAGFYGGESADVVAQLVGMMGRRFAVLLRDPIGTVRLAGTPLVGLEFVAEYRTGAKPGERRGWAWAFRGKLDSPPLYYSGSFELEDGSVLTGTVQPVIIIGGDGGPARVEDPTGTLITEIEPGQKLVLDTAFGFTWLLEDE